MSTARALSGETYTTRVVPAISWPAAWALYSESIATRKPASVLPEPVGAATSVSRPRAMSAQPRACGSVGPSGERRVNPSAIGGGEAGRAGVPSVAHRVGGSTPPAVVGGSDACSASVIPSEARDLGSTLRSLVVPPRDDNPE